MKIIWKKSILTLITFIICLLFMFLTYITFKPATINKLLASILHQNPINESFDDENFYELVIDSYNNATGSNKNYDDNLTDEELKQIISIYSIGYKSDENKITSLKGIEKLTELREINLSHQNIETIDLSNNINLKYLNLADNNIDSINLNNLINLEYLSLTFNRLADIDLSGNINLNELYLYKNRLNSIDLSGNTNLKHVELYNNNINEINVNNLDKLEYLDLGYNDIVSINLNDDVKLKNLNLNDNELTSINLSSNSSLKQLSLSKNKLSEIDLSNLIDLERLILSKNKLSEIDLRNNLNLKYLYLNDNFLSSINLSKNLELVTMNITQTSYYKALDEYDFSPIVLPDGYRILGYTSSDENVIKIENNKIEVLDLGTSNINMTYYDANNNENVIDIGNIITYEVVSNKYNIDDNLNIMTVNMDDEDEILRNISINMNDESMYKYIENDSLKICLGLSNCDTLLKEYQLIRYSSTKYDLDSNYIYIGNNMFDLDSIEVINCQSKVIDNRLIIKYNEEELLNIPIIKYESDYELIGNYVYIGASEFEFSKFRITNGYIKQNEDKINIYNDSSNYINSINIARISSDKYDLSSDLILTDDFDINDIKVVNVNKEYSNNKLYIKVDDQIVKTYDVKIKEIKKTTEEEKISSKTKVSQKLLNKLEKNAKTYDDIIKYFILSCTSILLITSILIYTKMKK